MFSKRFCDRRSKESKQANNKNIKVCDGNKDLKLSIWKGTVDAAIEINDESIKWITLSDPFAKALAKSVAVARHDAQKWYRFLDDPAFPCTDKINGLSVKKYLNH